MFDLHDAIRKHDGAWRRCQPRLRALYDAIGRPIDLCFEDWEMIFRCLESFRPRWIIELGRCTGNSTLLFADYCNRHGATLTSLDLDNNHFAATLGRLRDGGIEPPASLDAQDIRTMNILDWTPSDDAPSGPALLFVDAHGTDVGRHVVDEIVPRLDHRDEPLLMITHDIVDLRHETIGPTKYKMPYQWRHFASTFSEIIELQRLWEQYPVQSAAEARRVVTGRDTQVPDGVGFCGVFVTCAIPARTERRTAPRVRETQPIAS